MNRTEELWSLAQDHAHRFLRRFEDPLTRTERDDIAQESAIAAWQWADAVREPRRFEAAVRTIARRKRCRALRDHHRRRAEEHAAGAVHEERGSSRPGDPPGFGSGFHEPSCMNVAGRRVPQEWLVPRLVQAMSRLRPIDRCILMALQEGFCGAEIADRYQLTEHNVKVRTHRARRRLRTEIEDAVRTAAQFDGFDH